MWGGHQSNDPDYQKMSAIWRGLKIFQFGVLKFPQALKIPRIPGPGPSVSDSAWLKGHYFEKHCFIQSLIFEVIALQRSS